MTTWNPADKSGDITLSGSNRIATRNSGAGAWRSVRALTGRATGVAEKRYFEIAANSLGAVPGSFIGGIAQAGMTLTNFTGSSADSYGLQAGNTVQRNFYTNNTPTVLAALSAIVATERMSVAIDLSTRKLWVGTKGTWSGDPVAGTGEAAVVGAGTYYPTLSLFDNPGEGRLYSDGSFLYNVPAGFESWDPDATPKQVAVRFVDRSGTSRANLAGLQWAFFEDPLPGSFAAPFAKGNLETTDADGILSVSVTGTGLGIGEIGFLVVSNTDGTISESIAFAGPVTVMAA